MYLGRAGFLIAALMAFPANADTLVVTAKNAAHPPIVNAWPSQGATMMVPNLTPYACRDFLAQMQHNPLAASASCLAGTVDKTIWHGGFSATIDPGA
jgi:hypothetical protein